GDVSARPYRLYLHRRATPVRAPRGSPAAGVGNVNADGNKFSLWNNDLQLARVPALPCRPHPSGNYIRSLSLTSLVVGRSTVVPRMGPARRRHRVPVPIA